MHTGRRLRRVASGVFILALLALLIVPVGSMARPPHSTTTVGSPKVNVATVQARTHHAASHESSTDRFQLDPVTPPDATVEPTHATPSPVDQLLLPSPEIQLGDPTVRGPPAL